MEGLEGLYLEFTAAGFCFLAGLSWVEEVRGEGVWEKNVPMLDWENVVGWKTDDCPGYRILLEYEGKRLAVPAENVTGVREVDPRQMFELKRPVQNEKNQFIRAAVDLGEHGKSLAFVLSMGMLADLAVINSE